jgi:geranylgeranyl pyrophosphate synthase
MRLRDGELDIALERVDRRIREIVGGSDRMVLQYIADMGTSRGKRLRPRLMIAVAGLCGGAPAASLANCAACCELLHTATLIHDDVIDEAPTRRGSLTLSNMYGNEIAVVVGDYLLALVLRALNSERDHVLVDMLLATSQELGMGVIEEVLNRNNFVLSVEKYYDIIYLKTASLFALCCGLGAYLASATDTWQAATRHAVGQAPVPVKDSETARVHFPATPEDFHIYRRQLPHWRLSGSLYFVTWRVHPAQPDLPPLARDLMVENLHHFDGERYHLVGYVVMNDHVHVLVKPVEGRELSKILHTWKSFTANQIQKQVGWQGPVFQDESWDRIVRDEEELLDKAEYVLNNPRKRWPEQQQPYRWSYLNLESAGAPWHQDRLNTESRQARGPVPPALSNPPAAISGELLDLAQAYGKTLGLAFQVVDDLLDLTADSTATGKPAMNDIREGRITLPVIHALLNDGAQTKELIAVCQSEHDAAAERALKDHLASTGSIRFAYAEAERLLAEARVAGQQLALAAGSDATGELEQLEKTVIGVLELPREMAG